MSLKLSEEKVVHASFETNKGRTRARSKERKRGMEGLKIKMKDQNQFTSRDLQLCCQDDLARELCFVDLTKLNEDLRNSEFLETGS
jgi:hypothetical protein